MKKKKVYSSISLGEHNFLWSKLINCTFKKEFTVIEWKNLVYTPYTIPAVR